jgi:hypothetical protein
MIDLSKTPEAVYGLTHNDRLMVGSIEVYFRATGLKCWLTTVDSNLEEYYKNEDEDNYGKYVFHLREDKGCKALMTRQEMYNLLVSGNYAFC